MLVVDILEHHVLEDAQRLRHLDEYRRSAAGLHRLTQRLCKVVRAADVLQRHLAADEVALGRAGAGAVEVLDHAGFGARLQEFALAAADLDDGLAVQLEALDEVLRQREVELVERRRVGLRLLVATRVLSALRVEGLVADEAATGADPEFDVASREGEGLLARIDQDAAVGGDTRQPEKGLHRVTAGGTATVSDVRIHGGFHIGIHTTTGSGTGMMNLPPRRRYSACCEMISSAKFQGRIKVYSGWLSSSQSGLRTGR